MLVPLVLIGSIPGVKYQRATGYNSPGPENGRGLTGPELESPAPHGTGPEVAPPVPHGVRNCAEEAKIQGGKPRGNRVEKIWLTERILWTYHETLGLRLCREFL